MDFESIKCEPDISSAIIDSTDSGFSARISSDVYSPIKLEYCEISISLGSNVESERTSSCSVSLSGSVSAKGTQSSSNISSSIRFALSFPYLNLSFLLTKKELQVRCAIIKRFIKQGILFLLMGKRGLKAAYLIFFVLLSLIILPIR